MSQAGPLQASLAKRNDGHTHGDPALKIRPTLTQPADHRAPVRGAQDRVVQAQEVERLNPKPRP